MFKRLLGSRTEEEFFDSLSHHGGAELSAEQALHRQLSGVEELEAKSEEGPGFALHRAAFDNDVAALRDLLGRLNADEKLALDPQGNTALHVAVLRGHEAAVKLLMDGGVPPDYKNRQRWTAIDEAVALRDERLTKLLYTWLVEDMKRQLREKKARLLGVLEGMQDFTLKLRWELGSPIFGLLLRRYAPDDTYTLRKVGTRLRVDGTLMGIDHEAKSLLPTWKRGSFSLVVDAATSPATLRFLDHSQRKWVDMSEENKGTPRDLDKEVRELLVDGATKLKWRSEELNFQQARTWLGRPATEKVEGWSTQVFECTGKLVAVSHRKPHVALPADICWEEYLELPLPEDEKEEILIDPLAGPPPALKGGGKQQQQAAGGHTATSDSVASFEGGGAGGKSKQRRKPDRKVAGKCWMAQDFPMSLRQLVPLLEVIGTANKHVGRAATFMQRFSQHNLFPVRVQVPLAWTVHLLVTFREFKYLEEGAAAPDLFQVPQGYQCVGFDGLVEGGEGRRDSAPGGASGGSAGAQLGGGSSRSLEDMGPEIQF